MLTRARRLLLHILQRQVRRALLVLCLWLPLPVVAGADAIETAFYEGETGRYAHGVLGDALEYETLALRMRSGQILRFTLPQTMVFEDVAPRLFDLDGDGAPEVIAVESDQTRGARLAIYSVPGRITATPFIGTRFRWLAPLGAADLDGDGRMEIAFVDRPHLAKTLRIWRFEAETLTEVASFAGVTNHRIGEEDIAGGIRNCGGAPEMILSDAGWQSLLALRFVRGDISLRQIGTDTSRPAFAAAMRCESG
ncbi:MAG: FG-GAP repeat domain-containing protein [Roseobacter sp.]